MSRCVIVKDVRGKRWFWGETGIGLTWLSASKDVQVFDTMDQAKQLLRTTKKFTKGAQIVPVSDVRSGVKRGDDDESALFS